MSNYTERLTITVPHSLNEIAAKIGRAMDPDTGGDRSFTREIVSFENEEPVYGNKLVCCTPCVAEFKEAAFYMLSSPEMLFESCKRDYAARWPDIDPPTIEECELFCSNVEII